MIYVRICGLSELITWKLLGHSAHATAELACAKTAGELCNTSSCHVQGGGGAKKEGGGGSRVLGPVHLAMWLLGAPEQESKESRGTVSFSAAHGKGRALESQHKAGGSLGKLK